MRDTNSMIGIVSILIKKRLAKKFTQKADEFNTSSLDKLFDNHLKKICSNDQSGFLFDNRNVNPDKFTSDDLRSLTLWAEQIKHRFMSQEHNRLILNK